MSSYEPSDCLSLIYSISSKDISYSIEFYIYNYYNNNLNFIFYFQNKRKIKTPNEGGWRGVSSPSNRVRAFNVHGCMQT